MSNGRVIIGTGTFPVITPREVTELFATKKPDQECVCSFCRPAAAHSLAVEIKQEPIKSSISEIQRTRGMPPPLISTSLIRTNGVHNNELAKRNEFRVTKKVDVDPGTKAAHAQKGRQPSNKQITCICSFCSKSFTTTRSLELHVRRHSGLRPYPCRFCDKSFYQPSERTVHMRTHTGARPYRCPHCLKLFRYSGDLKQHINIHTGQRPYQCEICAKAFTNHSTLRQHKRIHTGERPYECLECSKTYRYHSSLKQHRMAHLKKAGLQSLVMTSTNPTTGNDVKN